MGSELRELLTTQIQLKEYRWAVGPLYHGSSCRNVVELKDDRAWHGAVQ